jgi:hypothetical protein
MARFDNHRGSGISFEFSFKNESTGTITPIYADERILGGDEPSTIVSRTKERGKARRRDAGQSIPFVLSYGLSFQSPPPPIDPCQALERTEAFWRQWSDRCPDVGPYRSTLFIRR